MGFDESRHCSQFVGYYQSVYGDNVKFTYSDGTVVNEGTGTRMGTITATDKYTISMQLPVLADGKPYGYFEPEVLTFANNIIPIHIFENIPIADWSTSPFNTGQGYNYDKRHNLQWTSWHWSIQMGKL